MLRNQAGQTDKVTEERRRNSILYTQVLKSNPTIKVDQREGAVQTIKVMVTQIGVMDDHLLSSLPPFQILAFRKLHTFASHY